MKFIPPLLYRYSDQFALSLAVVIAILSLMPQQSLDHVSMDDKLQHVSAYLLLGFFAGLSRQSLRTTLGTLVAVTLFGVLLELLQPWFGRFFEVRDLYANALGAVMGSLLAYGLKTLSARQGAT
ncbi:MAG: VanZ family protein [Gammaproteobacteria bacterium]|nr:VanZ family protein [Gammaproteobacteria bacterium]